MAKAFILALGICACVLGGEFLITDRFIMNEPVDVEESGWFQQAQAKNKEFVPPEWAAWSLLSAGSVVILYALALPKPQAQ